MGGAQVKFGSETITVVSTTSKFHKGEESSIVRNFENRYKTDTEGLAVLLADFIEELSKLENLKTASVRFEYPQSKKDNQFFVVESYSVIV